jgi:hypothetical protein
MVPLPKLRRKGRPIELHDRIDERRRTADRGPEAAAAIGSPDRAVSGEIDPDDRSQTRRSGSVPQCTPGR